MKPSRKPAAGSAQTALGAFYRRLAARVGKAKKVVTATMRTLAVLFYNMLSILAKVNPTSTSLMEATEEPLSCETIHF